MTKQASSLNEELSQLHADFCSALADQRRLLLIYALAKKSRTVNELAHELGVSQPSISRHLKILRERGLVRGKRDGASIEYRLADHRLIEALDILRQIMRDQLQHRANISHSGDRED
ncbi:MAG TPA: metalloregulator ArsR/SmtB family transcription factor [Anaerolineales bacterium]|nr:metalloregulator ArsR/SmtB family transcription factor [Anaerolineales bacterium]